MTRRISTSVQTHIRSLFEAAAPLSRLRCGYGSGGRSHTGARRRKAKSNCGSPTWIGLDLIRSWRLEKLGKFNRYADFVVAPSMTTPAVTYFHKATSNLRANATIELFFIRPLFDSTLALYQRLRAEHGWCRNHSHANWIIVVRSLALPAFDTPCSRSIVPLCHGEGARPAYAAACLRLSK